MTSTLKNIVFGFTMFLGMATAKDADAQTRVKLYDKLFIDKSLLFPKTGRLLEVLQDSTSRDHYKLTYAHDVKGVFHTTQYNLIDRDKDQKIYPSDITGIHATRFEIKKDTIYTINATDTVNAVIGSIHPVGKEKQVKSHTLTKDKSTFIENMKNIQFWPSAADRRQNAPRKEI